MSTPRTSVLCTRTRQRDTRTRGIQRRNHAHTSSARRSATTLSRTMVRAGGRCARSTTFARQYAFVVSASAACTPPGTTKPSPGSSSPNSSHSPSPSFSSPLFSLSSIETSDWIAHSSRAVSRIRPRRRRFGRRISFDHLRRRREFARSPLASHPYSRFELPPQFVTELPPRRNHTLTILDHPRSSSSSRLVPNADDLPSRHIGASRTHHGRYRHARAQGSRCES